MSYNRREVFEISHISLYIKYQRKKVRRTS